MEALRHLTDSWSHSERAPYKSSFQRLHTFLSSVFKKVLALRAHLSHNICRNLSHYHKGKANQQGLDHSENAAGETMSGRLGHAVSKDSFALMLVAATRALTDQSQPATRD